MPSGRTKEYLESIRPLGLDVARRRQQAHDEKCKKIIEDAARSGCSLRTAADRLEAHGILMPMGDVHWTTSAVWRIAKRHGIHFADKRRRAHKQ